MLVRRPPTNVRLWNKKLRRQYVNQRRRAKTGKPKMAATDSNSELLPVDRNRKLYFEKLFQFLARGCCPSENHVGGRDSAQKTGILGL